ncbi:IstB-like ATP binding protein [Alkalispirochaeta americana]|uniref:IstB-like ATP binding protein n=1 Tax=Alkalispirochaeta americana TaxID=159291 RepID=A0A1N6RFB1_9SPIO|nr:ATP-binding protein [Alkalispirochaeta americana]SIQ27521.1 IstB-like ATP binding protein [Alkalispirochaeta americana]
MVTNPVIPNGKIDSIFQRFSKTGLLIIDDFGLTPLNSDDRLSLLELLDDRYNTAGTIITGQVPIGAWHEIIGEPTIADAIMDRLAHTPWIFELKGGSRRRQTPSD